MSPVPRLDRLDIYARKGVELLLREIGEAPEQRSARRLSTGAPPSPGAGPRVLVVSLRDWAAHVQYEAMIGQALRLRGADVHVLTCGGGLEICDRANTYEAPPMPCRTCTRYVETSVAAHRFPSLTIRSGWEADDPASWPEIDDVSLDALVDVEADGLPFGRLVDIPLRWFLCAAALDEEPLAGLTNRAMLRSARRIAKGVERALDRIQPDVVLLLNGLFLFEAVAWAICRRRGIDVVTYERAFRKETLVFSRRLPAGFYDRSERWPAEDRPLRDDEVAELDEYLTSRRRGGGFDQHWTFVSGNSVERGSGRLAVLFTNLTWDTAVIGRNVAFPDIRSWIDAVIAAFTARPEDRLVIRIHPSEVGLPGKQTRDSLDTYVRVHHPELPTNITLIGAADKISSYDFIDACDLGLVYTSTVGLELALAGKPVIVCGGVHYRDKGFTLDAATADDFVDLLQQALTRPESVAPDVDRARRYAHYFWFRGPTESPFVAEPIGGLARLTTSDLADLAPGANAAVDRICDFILGGPEAGTTPPVLDHV